MFHHAEIIAVGSELLLGSVANTDAQYVSQKLAAVGVDVLYHTVVGDNPERLRQTRYPTPQWMRKRIQPGRLSAALWILPPLRMKRRRKNPPLRVCLPRAPAAKI